MAEQGESGEGYRAASYLPQHPAGLFSYRSCYTVLHIDLYSMFCSFTIQGESLGLEIYSSAVNYSR